MSKNTRGLIIRERREKRKKKKKKTEIKFFFPFLSFVLTMAEEKNKSLQQWITDNSGVFTKLITFTVALFAFPILTFFYTVHNWFEG